MPNINRWPHLIGELEIEAWADRIDSRGQFPGVVRMLISRNNDQITRLDMRDAEGVDAHGYDGVVDALRASTLVPIGHSVWEMGTNGDPRAKANHDYRERCKDPQGEDPANTTFVFVTPRRWDSKDDWAKKRTEDGPWKSVRVLDVSNLLQGLDEAPAVHVRFSEIAGKAASAVRSIEDWWQRFCAASSPTVTTAIALAGRSNHAAQLLSLLEEVRNLTTIRSRSIDDVLAFVAASILTAPEEDQSELLSRTLIVHDATALRQLDSTDTLLILLPFEEQMRREAELVGSNHVLLMCEEELPADIELPAVDIAEVTQLLLANGVGRDLATELGRAAGISLKRFQRVASQQRTPQPEWNTAFQTREVRRAWLLRSWTTMRSGDLDIFERFVSRPFEDVEETLKQASRGADPIFSVLGTVWNVGSPADFWDYVRPHLTSNDLEALERAVQDVLGAVDPALELPPDERWLAGIRGMSRIHSRELRRGLATTMALVGVKGESVALGGGITGGTWVRSVLDKLFNRANSDNTGQLWASLADVLPLLAEAAPDVFLRALDSATSSSNVLTQMFTDGQHSDSLTSSSPHTGLLWAIEVTAWLKPYFAQSINVLAKLAEVDPGGRLTNRPFSSLKDIFRPWLPQTLVNRADRLTVLASLIVRYPDIGPRLVIELLPSNNDIAMSNAKPKFRIEIAELERVDVREWTETTTALVSLLLPVLRDKPELWINLLGHLDDLPPAERDRVYDYLPPCIDAMNRDEQLSLWDKATDLIRRHREFPDTTWALPEEELERFEAAIGAARPDDPCDAARWLFDETHPDIGVSMADDIAAYDRAVDRLRTEAVQKILDTHGLDGLQSFVQTVAHAYLVGFALADVHK